MSITVKNVRRFFWRCFSARGRHWFVPVLELFCPLMMALLITLTNCPADPPQRCDQCVSVSEITPMTNLTDWIKGVLVKRNIERLCLNVPEEKGGVNGSFAPRHWSEGRNYEAVRRIRKKEVAVKEQSCTWSCRETWYVVVEGLVTLFLYVAYLYHVALLLLILIRVSRSTCSIKERLLASSVSVAVVMEVHFLLVRLLMTERFSSLEELKDAMSKWPRPTWKRVVVENTLTAHLPGTMGAAVILAVLDPPTLPINPFVFWVFFCILFDLAVAISVVVCLCTDGRRLVAVVHVDEDYALLLPSQYNRITALLYVVDQHRCPQPPNSRHLLSDLSSQTSSEVRRKQEPLGRHTLILVV